MTKEKLVSLSPNDSKLDLHPMYTDEGNPRSQEPIDQALKTSIAKDGVVVPLIAVADPNTKKFLIIAGQRRLKAAKAIVAEGRADFQIPVLIRAFESEDTAFIQHMVENNLRRANSPLTTAAEVYACIKRGMSYEAVGLSIGGTHQTARNYAALHTMPQFIKKDVEAGKMSPTAAFALQTKAYKKTDNEGNETWDVEKLRKTISEMKESAKMKGDKVKVSDAKGAKEGKPNTKISYDDLRKIAANEKTPEVFALLLQAIAGDIDVEAARLRADGELDWFLVPSKAKKVKTPKVTTASDSGKKEKKPTKKAAKVTVAVEDEESLATPTVGEDDMADLFGEE